jgi:hypothetical protein
VYILHFDYIYAEAAVNMYSVIFLARSFRLLTYLSEIEAFAVIGNTFNRLTRPFASMVFTLYTVYYIYANLGMVLFSATITTTSI